MSAGRGEPSRPARAVPTGRYGWFLGVVVVLFLAYVTLNTATTHHDSSRGLPAGQPLPAFAVPLALTLSTKDADVATHPNSGGAGAIPACDLRRHGILNVCQLAERGPVVLSFFFTRGAHCEGTLDTLQALARAFPGLQLAGVAVAGDVGDIAAIVRRHRWTFPVGYDHDGLVANLYGVAGCPQTTFATVGGIVRETVLGTRGAAYLRERIRDVVRASEAMNWHPPAR